MPFPAKDGTHYVWYSRIKEYLLAKYGMRIGPDALRKLNEETRRETERACERAKGNARRQLRGHDVKP